MLALDTSQHGVRILPIFLLATVTLAGYLTLLKIRFLLTESRTLEQIL